MPCQHQTPGAGGHQRGYCGLYRRRGGLPDGGGGFAAAAPGPPLNLWGMSGRSEAMQLRLLMQRRSLR